MNKEVWNNVKDVLIILVMAVAFVGLCAFSKKLFLILCFTGIAVCWIGAIYCFVAHYNYQNRKR